jgi:hypothetical protein
MTALFAAIVSAAGAAGEPAAQEVAFDVQADRVRITVGGEHFAWFVLRDKKIPRPYFCDLRAPGGMAVSRTHPPVPGKDAVDHDTIHPGLWLAIGNLSGQDFWRNRARIEHVRFSQPPKGGPGKGGFVAEHRWVAADGKAVAEETFRLTVHTRPSGRLLVWESEFRPAGGEIVFGDEKVGVLGVRLASDLTVEKGGSIRDAEGRRNEAEAFGKTAKWCDASGMRDGIRVGVTLMDHPSNFRPSSLLARDYGLLAVNPFGRKALSGGEKSEVRIKRGESLTLRYGVFVHAATAYNPDAAFKDYLDAAGK